MRKLLILAVCIVLAACHPADKGIKVGAVYNLTGSLSGLDVPAANATKLAVKQINLQGGIKGRKLQLVLYDGKSQLLENKRSVYRLINQDKVMAIMGLTDSDILHEVMPLTTKTGIPIITSGAASPSLESLYPDNLFYTCVTDNQQAGALAEFAVQKAGLRTVMILTDSTLPSAVDLSAYFREAYEHNGGWLLNENPFEGGKIDYRLLVSVITSMPITPSAIFLASSPSVSADIIFKLRQYGVKLPILGGEALDSNALVELTQQDSSSVYFATHAFLSKESRDAATLSFIDQYTTEYGNAPESAFAALGYDTVKYIQDVLVKTGKTDRESLRNALGHNTMDKAISGKLVYKNNHHYPTKPVFILEAAGGRRYLADTVEAAYIPAPKTLESEN